MPESELWFGPTQRPAPALMVSSQFSGQSPDADLLHMTYGSPGIWSDMA